MASLELVLLGTGSPIHNPDRCGAGNVIISGNDRIVVDLGWGAARRLPAAGVLPPFVNTVFYTHLHSDHITDTADFLISRWTGGATVPLTVYGPTGTRAMFDGFLAALAADIGYRFAHHGEKLSREGILCDVREFTAAVEGTQIAEINGTVVRAFEVDHRPVVPAYGYRFERDGVSIALSGDTGKCPGLENAARGADILVCEALNPQLWAARVARVRAGGNERGASMLEDVPDYHIATLDAAAIARDAAVGHLVLSHLLPGPPPDTPLADAFVSGMAEVYNGTITLGRDLQRFSVG